MNNYQTGSKYCYFRLLRNMSIGMIILIILICGTAFAKDRKRVLFISSYHPAFPTFFQQVNGIKDSFSEKPIYFDVEFMDTKRFPDKSNWKQFKERLSYKLSQAAQYDVIMVGDDNALAFALEQQSLHFKGKPIVFFGVNDIQLASQQNSNPQVTGIVESVSMKDTIDLMIKLRAEVSRIIALVDSTPSGQGDLKTFYQTASQFRGLEFSALSLSELSWMEFGKALQNIGEDSAVLLLSAYEDKENIRMEFNESLEIIKRNLSVPIYHLWYHGIGSGLLGGKVISHYEQGKTAAGIVLHILDGNPIDQFKVITESPNRYLFDYDQLKKHSLSISMLPPNSILLNEPYSIYKEQKKLIWGTAFVFLILLIALLLTTFNIIRRKQSERKLRLSHERFVTVLDSLDASVYVADMDTYEILFMNKFMKESFGRDMTGETCWEVFRGKTGACQDCTNDQLTDENGKPTGVCVWQGKNPITGKIYIHHDRAIEWSDGHLVRLEIATDITDMKNMEAQLIQTHKMEAIGTLAGGIAHDFNNILGAIFGYTELALMETVPGSDVHKKLKEVFKAGERARNLVKQILNFSRQADSELMPLQLTPVIKEVIKFIRASLPTSIEIRPELKSDPTMLADINQIHQVIMNLCTNAAHAMQDRGGILEIRLESVELDSEFTARHSGLQPGVHVKLTVSDTGAGISSDLMDRIFDPFFTTKGKGEGTGMGLSLVHGIVESHRGAITVYSKPGKGSVFTIFFPAIERRGAQDTRPEKALPGGTESILFIDDEAPLVELGITILGAVGYNVTGVKSSVEALELFEENPDRFDLIITDLAMPQMTGDRLAKKFMKIKPGIPIILCTGFSASIDRDRAMDMGIRAFVNKPILRHQLFGTIRNVLDNTKDLH